MKISQKRSTLFTFVFLVALGLYALRPSSLRAQESSGGSGSSSHLHSVGFGLGQYFLTGAFDNQGDDGLGFALRYNYLGTGDVFHLNANLLYASLGGEQDFKMWGFTGGVKANMIYLDTLVPYAVAGLGFYNPSVSIQGSREGSLTFGFHLGVGADLVINDQFELGGELTFHNPFDTDTDTKAGKVDLNGAFFTMMIRGGYRF